jgi:WG repeat protein
MVLSGYKSAWPFSEGLAVVGLPGKMGYIDTAGRSVIPPQYSEGGKFKEGLASVKVDKNGDTSTETAGWSSRLNSTTSLRTRKVLRQ